MRAPRTEPRPEFTTQSLSGLMTMCTSSPFCWTMLYIDGRVPGGGFGRLLLAEVDAELVLVRRRAALLVDGPCIGFVAAADDAVVAGDVELLRVLRDDREAVDLTFVSHGFLPQSTLDSRPYSSSSRPSA